MTSDYIPRMVYMNSYSQDGTLKGYLNYTLSYFNTSDFEKDHGPNFEGSQGVEICRYSCFILIVC
jgi:hypothetical protein